MYHPEVKKKATEPRLTHYASLIDIQATCKVLFEVRSKTKMHYKDEDKAKREKKASIGPELKIVNRLAKDQMPWKCRSFERRGATCTEIENQMECRGISHGEFLKCLAFEGLLLESFLI